MISTTENNEDLQKYLFAPGKIGRHLQGEIDLPVTDGKLNNARVRNQLDSLYKNAFGRRNPYEIVFKDISKFDGQNPIIHNLLAEIENRKLTNKTAHKFLDRALSAKDLEVKNNLGHLNNCDKAKNALVVPKFPLNNDSYSNDSDNEIITWITAFQS